MHWYGDLYIGTTAVKDKSRIIKKLKKHRFMKNVYVITRAFNGCDLFDIYPANVLTQKYYKTRDFFVIGIAVGYDEAVSVVKEIVEELYLSRGIENLKDFFDEAWAEAM